MSVRPPAYSLNPIVGLVWARGRATIIDGRITLDPADSVTYELVQEELKGAELDPPRRLLFELAAIDSPEAALRFARAWGFLWTGANADRYDELLADWFEHAKRLRFILRLHLTLRRSVESRSHEHTTTLREMVAPWIQGIRANSPTAAAMIETFDVQRQAAVWISELVNPVLGEVREGIIADGSLEYGEAGDHWFRGDPLRFHFAPNFSSLIAYAYHSLSQSLSANILLFECERCEKVTQRRHGRQKFCGTRCARASRDEAYRSKQSRDS